jgi:hypothetical protein
MASNEAGMDNDAAMPARRRSGRVITKSVRYSNEMNERPLLGAENKEKGKASKSAMHSSSSYSLTGRLQPVEVQVQAFGMNEATVKELRTYEKELDDNLEEGIPLRMKVLQPEIKFLRKVSNLKEDAKKWLRTCTPQTICRKGTNKLSPEYKRQVKVFGRDAYPSAKHKKARKNKESQKQGSNSNSKGLRDVEVISVPSAILLVHHNEAKAKRSKKRPRPEVDNPQQHDTAGGEGEMHLNGEQQQPEADPSSTLPPDSSKANGSFALTATHRTRYKQLKDSNCMKEIIQLAKQLDLALEGWNLTKAILILAYLDSTCLTHEMIQISNLGSLLSKAWNMGEELQNSDVHAQLPEVDKLKVRVLMRVSEDLLRSCTDTIRESAKEIMTGSKKAFNVLDILLADSSISLEHSNSNNGGGVDLQVQEKEEADIERLFQQSLQQSPVARNPTDKWRQMFEGKRAATNKASVAQRSERPM